jgi:uncharacterized membrane protein
VSFLVIKVWQVYINILFCKRASNVNGQGRDHSTTLRSGMADSTIKLFLKNHIFYRHFLGVIIMYVYIIIMECKPSPLSISLSLSLFPPSFWGVKISFDVF